MRYKVWDRESKKERILDKCVTRFEIGSIRQVTVIINKKRETHHFRVLEVLPELE